MTNEKEPTLQDVLFAVNEFAQKTEENFEKIDKKFGILEKNLSLQIGKARNSAYDYADRKLDAAEVKIGKAMKEDKEYDKNFKEKLISVMKNNELANAQELDGLAQAI